jgi:hypothetical protein
MAIFTHWGKSLMCVPKVPHVDTKTSIHRRLFSDKKPPIYTSSDFLNNNVRLDQIPGLKIVPQFVADVDRPCIEEEAFRLHESIQKNAVFSKEKQAQTYLSKQHNLSSKETYRLVSLEDENGKKIDGQHFERYGEEGHQLTYFIGNNNIPSFVSKKIIASMEKLDAVERLRKKAGAPLVWNFTFNVYQSIKDNPQLVAGFPFHKDIASNGEITAIFSLLSEAEVQMKHESEVGPTYSGILKPGSLFVLSGEARWSWLHRIVPKTLGGERPEQSIHRMSLVLGCHLP